MLYYGVYFQNNTVLVFQVITIIFSESLFSEWGRFSWRVKPVLCYGTESDLSQGDVHCPLQFLTISGKCLHLCCMHVLV